MLLLKVEHLKDVKYYKFQDKNIISLRKEKRMHIVIKGDIILNFLDDKWSVFNKTDKPIRFGHGFIKPNKSKTFKTKKVIKYNKYKISALDYKEKEIKQISPGFKNSNLDLTKKTEYTIGRSKDCDIVVNNPQVDKVNTRIIHDGDIYYIEDLNSSNGLYVNGKKVKTKILENYDTISIPGAIYMLAGDKLLQSKSNEGIRIDARHIYKRVRDYNTHKYIYLVNDVCLTIKEGEYVAIVGGSGAGKSTFVDTINGRRPMTEGEVFYDLNDFYKYFKSYQKIVGYVPQSDIMHTDLSVYKTLYYYAQIKMRHNLDKDELKKLVLDTLEQVSLLDKKDLIVSSLSGGQKKRVSIAMELLANPKVLFLDEPTSGLSPDLDYDIMMLLHELSKKHHKTVIIITHNMENVDKCDKIAFLGKGGRLCYFGKPKDIFKYFGVKKYGQIFSLLTDTKNVEFYEDKLKKSEEYIKMLNKQDSLYLGSD